MPVSNTDKTNRPPTFDEVEALRLAYIAGQGTNREEELMQEFLDAVVAHQKGKPAKLPILAALMKEVS